jgi:hypothetical protein
MAHPLLDDLAMRRATSRPPSRPRQPLRRLTCCLLIATLAVPPAATGAARSAPSAEAAISSARSLASSLGLRAGSELVARHHFTNAQGRTVVHADQTFQGHRVWGAQAIIHAEAWGGTNVLPQGLLPDAQPVGQPALTDRRATDIAGRPGEDQLRARRLPGPLHGRGEAEARPPHRPLRAGPPGLRADRCAEGRLCLGLRGPRAHAKQGRWPEGHALRGRCQDRRHPAKRHRHQAAAVTEPARPERQRPCRWTPCGAPTAPSP